MNFHKRRKDGGMVIFWNERNITPNSTHFNTDFYVYIYKDT
jgi:hypothetical protein